MEYKPARRRLLASFAAALLPTQGCSVLPVPLCPTDPAISDPNTPLTIDAHTHVFNGSDLQIKEFIAQTVVGHEDSELYQLAQVLGGVLQALAWQGAPNAREETRVLSLYDGQFQDCAGSDRVSKLAAPAFQDGYARGRSALQSAAKSVSRSPDGAAVLGPRPMQSGPGLGAAIEDLPPTYEEFQQRRADRASILGSQPHLLGYISFVLHQFNYRHVNAIDYLTTYSRNSPRKVDLVVPSMVDYDWWLARGKPTETTLEDQVDVMARIAVIAGGRVHGFAPFCPFRETMTRGADGVGDSLRLVKRAVQTQGFLGVKLYPPMGFAAWDNASRNVWKGKSSLPRVAWEPDFGKRLDAAIQSLYEWCMANDVPIMAHANRSNGPYDEFKALAGSEYWKLALEKFPGLKVSFGHFGDTDVEDHNGDRSRAFVKLMTGESGSAGENAFADSGYFAGALLNPVAMANVLARLYADSERGVLRERLMYGTDWTMILPQQRAEAYLREFIGVMARIEAAGSESKIRSTSLSNAFFGHNAAHFLGLHRGKPARRRLEAFYERHKLSEPDWMRKVG